MRLNLGCGQKRLGGYVNVDISPAVSPDIVHDLDVGPWPFESGAASHILADSVFEHVSDPILFMAECHRVLEPGGILELIVPHYESPDAFTDPTHKRFCTPNTFDYWIKGTLLYDNAGLAMGGHDHPFNLEYDIDKRMRVVLRRLEPDFKETS